MLALFAWTRRKLPAGLPGPSYQAGIPRIHGHLPAILFEIGKLAVALHRAGVRGYSRAWVSIVFG